MRIEVLAFEGCPNAEPAVQLGRDVAIEMGVDPEIELIPINGLDAAQTHRFLGSPSIRIDGADVELGTELRPAMYGCRIYRGAGGRPAFPTVHGLLPRYARPLSRPNLSRTGSLRLASGAISSC